MNRKYSTIIEKEYFYEITDLLDYGVKIVLTKKSFKNSMEKSKEEMLLLLGEENKFIASGYQKHTKNIKIYNDKEHLFDDNTDGFVSSNKDIILYAKFADCLPIILYDKKNDIRAVLHSGWRGSFQNIASLGVDFLKDNFNSNIKDILVVFGFGISAKNYEVQENFYQDFKANFPKEIVESSFIIKANKYYFDNLEFNYQLLKKHGIPTKNIFLNNMCTFDNNKLDSYRREGENAGRSACFVYKID